MTVENFVSRSSGPSKQDGSVKKWTCLDAEGIIVGHLVGETAQEAIREFINLRSGSASFRRPVSTLVSGGIRLNVKDLNTC
jgi:hypothetical protein